MELQEALDIIEKRLTWHDDRSMDMPSDCAAINEDQLCCVDKTVWAYDELSAREDANPLRVAIDVVCAEAIRSKNDLNEIIASVEKVEPSIGGRVVHLMVDQNKWLEFLEKTTKG